jgi:hypothetical protein
VHAPAGSGAHPPLFTAQSLMSAQLMPFPVYPDGHASHVRVPAVLVHATGGEIEQPPLLVAHSLTSVQVRPLPV